MAEYLKYENISYRVLVWAGFGWSAGCGSTIQALDGPFKGKLYIADIGSGIYNLRGPMKSGDQCKACLGKGKFSRCTTAEPDPVCVICSGTGIYKE